MRVVFFGTPDFAVPTLRALHDAGHTIELVVAQPSRPAGRGKKLQAPPVAKAAAALNLPVAQPRAIHSGRFPERYRSIAPDVAVVVAYGRILKELHLHTPRFGAINLHASLLPRWRGAAPIQAAILAGDTLTGVCAQQMELGLDTGPIHLCQTCAIEPRETAGSLHDKLARLAADVAVQTLRNLPGNPTPQPEEGVCWAPKITKDDGKLDFQLDHLHLDRQIRAMTPWPGGWVPGPAGPLKILEAYPVEGDGPPGTVSSLDPLCVACGSGALRLERLQAPGRRPVSGRDFANGHRLAVGMPLWGNR